MTGSWFRVKRRQVNLRLEAIWKTLRSRLLKKFAIFNLQVATGRSDHHYLSSTRSSLRRHSCRSHAPDRQVHFWLATGNLTRLGMRGEEGKDKAEEQRAAARSGAMVSDEGNKEMRGGGKIWARRKRRGGREEAERRRRGGGEEAERGESENGGRDKRMGGEARDEEERRTKLVGSGVLQILGRREEDQRRMLAGDRVLRTWMLPLSLLRAGKDNPMVQLVELKNGETYNGILINCDIWMNLSLRDVVCTSRVRDGDKFWKIPECYIRGNNIKYLRVPDEVIDKVVDEPVKSKMISLCFSDIWLTIACTLTRSEERKEFAGRGRGRGVIGNRGGGNQGGGRGQGADRGGRGGRGGGRGGRGGGRPQ
eukprot:763007-Hanusia_phi.AAC.3